MSLLPSYYSSLDIHWKEEWFLKLPQSHWKSMENRRKFLENVSVQLNIQKPSDWGKIRTQHIHELGGGALLTSYYNGSLFDCLKSIYKGFR